jgi:regulator of protease activity HflC (stomatin/prohibitin superfamily)
MIAIVPANSAYVVERLGRYYRTLNPGLNILTPFLDRVAFRYSLLPQRLDLTDNCITLDNVPFTVTSSVQWQIVEPRVAAYAVASLTEFVTGLVRSCQRKWISEQSSKDVRETTRDFRQAVLRAAAEPAAKAGVRIVDHDIKRLERVTA